MTTFTVTIPGFTLTKASPPARCATIFPERTYTIEAEDTTSARMVAWKSYVDEHRTFLSAYKFHDYVRKLNTSNYIITMEA